MMVRPACSKPAENLTMMVRQAHHERYIAAPAGVYLRTPCARTPLAVCVYLPLILSKSKD